MHEAALAQAALPAPVVILHLAMMPYSLGHELLLHRRSNPFATQTQEGFNALPQEDQVSALIHASDVCSLTWKRNQWQPETRWQAWRLDRVYKKWEKSLKKTDWPVEIAEFRNYRQAGSICFEAELPTTASTGSVRYIGAPELLRLYQWLIANIPERELPESAWDYPLGLARMHYQCKAEAEGGLEIYNWRQKVHDDYVREREAQRIAEEKPKEATNG